MTYRLRHPARLLLATPVVFASTAAWPDPPAADTGAWKCEMCPFMQGYAVDVEGGVLGASGANATFGRYTGIDRNGVYADVSGSGQHRGEDGSFVTYELKDLGLDSAEGSATAGREGRYDVRLS